MRKTALALLALILAVCGLHAQSFDIYQTLEKHPEYLAGTDFICPISPAALTEAPKGYKPFYISRYGRHGARYAWQNDLYDSFNDLLTSASQEDNLTDTGKKLKEKFDSIYPEVRYRVGELSKVGWKQQIALAERAYADFPQVFEDGAKVTAYTSTSTRCAMTMSAYCIGLKGSNPKLDIFENYGRIFLPNVLPLNGDNPFRDTTYLRTPPDLGESWNEYIERKLDYNAILSRLIVDVDKAVPVEKRWKTVHYLYFLVNGMCSLENAPDMTFVFTPEERVKLWEIDNFQFYKAAWKTKDGYRQMVHGIIANADEFISGGGNGADLYFGHDFTISPLLMLLGVEGMDHECKSGDEINFWYQVHRIPMGAYLELVFYRNREGDVIFKAIFNGEEAHLNLPTDNWPYYKWNNLKDKYGK